MASENTTEKNPFHLDQKQIQEFLPHRFPFLMVDRILEITSDHPVDDEDMKRKVGLKVIGQKNVAINEPFFQGHFPSVPIMPGVMIIETMAQVASFSMYPNAIKKIQQQGESYQTVLVGLEDTRFRAPVTPGDVLKIETTVLMCRTSLWKFGCKAFVEGKLVAEATLLANLIPNSKRQVF